MKVKIYTYHNNNYTIWILYNLKNKKLWISGICQENIQFLTKTELILTLGIEKLKDYMS